MAAQISPDLIYDFLSSARVFARAVRDVVEGAVLREVCGDKLTTSHLKLLYLVAQTDAATIGDAAAFLGVSSSAASKTVEKLVRRRLLRRSDTQGDRRTSKLALTGASRRLLETYEAARNQKAAEIFAQYSPETIRRTAALLDHLASGIACARAAEGAISDEPCLQCEIYYRETCRFGEFGARKCFYRLHRSKHEKLTPATHDSEPEGDKEA
jgi:DNA-binding MarR family transcriptional regulator